MEGMQEFLKAAVQYGFSIVVAAYLLVRLEGRVAALTEAINELRRCMEVKTARFEEALRRGKFEGTP